jgi:A1 cistron-splicing factor AAR2
MNLDQETAKKLFDAGGIVLMLNSPSNLEFGIDCQSWKCGPKFKGIKFIPPGIHFIYYSVYTNQMSFRSGFWKEFKGGDLVISNWDAETEDFVEVTDQDQILRYKANIREFDSGLGFYPLKPAEGSIDTYQKWKQLTQYISPRLLDQLLPNKQVSAMSSVSRFSEILGETRNADLAQVEMMRPSEDYAVIYENLKGKAAKHDIALPLVTTSQVADQTKALSGASADSNYWINFTDIDLKRSYPPGADAAIISKYSMDKSHLLQLTIAQNYKCKQD